MHSCTETDIPIVRYGLGVGVYVCACARACTCVCVSVCVCVCACVCCMRVGEETQRITETLMTRLEEAQQLAQRQEAEVLGARSAQEASLDALRKCEEEMETSKGGMATLCNMLKGCESQKLQIESELQDELQQVTRVLQQNQEVIVALERQLDLVSIQGVCV